MLATGLVNRDNGSYIEYRDFELGYGLFAFDFSPSLLDEDQQFELVKSGALRLELSFHKLWLILCMCWCMGSWTA